MNNKHNFDYNESSYLPSVSYSLLCSEAGSLKAFLLWETVLKVCSKFTKEHPSRSVFSIKLFVSTWK